MGATLSKSQPSDPVRTLDSIRPTPAKAGLRSDQIGLNTVIADAVIAHYGSVKAAAISLSVDPSLMMREFKEGKFGRLDKADDETKAAIAIALQHAYATLATPQARVRSAVRDVRRRCDEIEQYLEFIA